MIIIDVVFLRGVVSSFVSKFRYFELRVASFRHFAWRFFVISSFCVASFRYFVFSRGVFSLFRYFALRYFVISSFRVALFRYFAWRYFVAKRRKDEMAQISHHKNEISMGNGCELLPIMLNRKTDRKRNSFL